MQVVIIAPAAKAVAAPDRIRQARATKIQSNKTSAKGRKRCGLMEQSQSAAPAANGRVLWNRRKSVNPKSRKMEVWPRSTHQRAGGKQYPSQTRLFFGPPNSFQRMRTERTSRPSISSDHGRAAAMGPTKPNGRASGRAQGALRM